MAHPRDGHRKIFAMMEAYLDESGIHDGAAICVIAGYFAEPREWKKFEIGWRKLLSDYLVPMREFRAKDVFNKKGFFHKWSEKTHTAFVGRALEAILWHKVYPLSSGVVVKDFKSFSLQERRYMTGATLFHGRGKMAGGCPNKPYFVPFQACVRKVTDYTPRQGRAHFVFGLDRTFASYATDLFRDMKTKAPILWRKKLGNPSFPFAAETPGPQAADTIAYLTYAHMTRHFSPEGWNAAPKDEIAYLLRRAKSASDFTCFNKACLQSMLDDLRLIAQELGAPEPFNKEL